MDPELTFKTAEEEADDIQRRRTRTFVTALLIILLILIQVAISFAQNAGNNTFYGQSTFKPEIKESNKINDQPDIKDTVKRISNIKYGIQSTADRPDAAPGDVIEYSVRVFNAGADSLANVVVIDPVSSWVDIEPNAFGAGLDLEWRPPVGPPVYFTFDPSDPDECEYDVPTRTLRVILSKNSAFYLAAGEAAVMVYQVRVR